MVTRYVVHVNRLHLPSFACLLFFPSNLRFRPSFLSPSYQVLYNVVLGGTIVNRTYSAQKNLYISLYFD